MSRKFLDDLGVNPVNYSNTKNDEEEIKTYGFSSKETWNLDITSAYWLYEHLMMFNKVNDCDLSGGSFEVKIVDEDSIKNLDKMWKDFTSYEQLCNNKPPFCPCSFKIANLNLQECIDTIIEYLKEYIVFFEKENSQIFYPKASVYIWERIYGEKLSCAFGIYALIINCMWW